MSAPIKKDYPTQGYDSINRDDHENKGPVNQREKQPHEWDAEDRQGFVTKVFGILAVQLAFTSAFVMIPLSNEGARKFMQEQWWLGLLMLIASIVLMLVLFCTKLHRKVPTNYILLSAFTFCEAYIVATISSQYTDASVAQAAAMTTIMVVSLSLYAKYTKTDFTGLGPYLFVAGIGLGIFGLFLMFFASPFLNTLYCAIGIILFGIYLVFDM